MTSLEREAMEYARHELTTLHGLVAADGAAPTITWEIDTSVAVAKLDTVLTAVAETDTVLS